MNNNERPVFATLPIVDCPHCGKAFQWDDYYELKDGDSRECPHCGKEIFCLGTDTVMVGTFGKFDPTKKP